MIYRIASCLLAVLVMVAAPAYAGTLKKMPAMLNPAKAYVVAEIGKLDDGLLPGSLILSRYDPLKRDVAAPTPPPGNSFARGGGPEDSRVSLLKALVRQGDRSLYVAELDPGLWVIEGANDTSFSLGSNTLQLAAGSVTDLGVITVYSDFADGEKHDTLTASRMLKGALMGGLIGGPMPKSVPKAITIRARGPSDIPVPTMLAATGRPVEWAGQVRFGNHLGGLINRMGGRAARNHAPTEEPVQQPDANVARTPEATPHRN